MADESELPRLQKRNVEVFDSDGAVIAGFWQYGTLTWDEFCRYMITFVVTTTAWTIFQYDTQDDTTQQRRGAPCQPSAGIVHPGHYILLSSTGEPLRIGLVPTLPRLRYPTHSNTPAPVSSYHARGRARDGKCLITGLQTQTYSRLKVAHIFPRAHNAEWIRKGYPSKITDTADEVVMGGPTKIDSVQNVITMRSDLHGAWDNYEIGVDPNNNYRITAFTNGNADVNDLYLKLDHIQDPTLRPLDELFTDHFMQGIFKHMKGAGEVSWSCEDVDDASGDGSLKLSNPKIWGTEEGRKRFELALSDRLFDHRISQQGKSET
ncbi:hypothetical protein EDB92DRAFT_1502550 [Lactarius akahatsu]|uniref:HNH nuclease domain-containing protein n=1 Tax=Lactarius akahatsu TaxID=416441 RepID=A0AAD4LC90_9AGAM|nr:hypothetical protein EDB92DRAFT_1502550 [Lactarius akahatsu]